MRKEVISIIVPVYNCEKYLDDCINSVMRQTNPNWELILVNDGSSDGSLKICKKFASIDLRVKYIDIPNQGVSNARNLGIDLSTGEYIMFIDSDDWIAESTLELSCKTQKRFNSDVVLFSYFKSFEGELFKDNYLHRSNEILSNIEYTRHRVVGFFNGKIDDPVKTDAFNTPWAKLYRREVIGDIRFIERSVVGMEDVLFNIQVFNNSKSFSYLGDYLYYYRLDNPNSLTKTDTKFLNTKFEKLFQHIQNSPFFDSSYNENIRNRVCCSLINLTLSLTHKNNRTNFFNQIGYLNSIVNSKRMKEAFDYFSFQGLPIHWKVFFFLGKYRLSFLLLIMAYLIRLLK